MSVYKQYNIKYESTQYAKIKLTQKNKPVKALRDFGCQKPVAGS